MIEKIMSTNNKKNLALALAAVVLFLALLDGWEYGFFTMLRFVVFAMTAYVAWLAYQNQKEKWVWTLGSVAVLFNPFFPIHLDRDTWVVIDLIAGVFLLSLTYFLRLENHAQKDI